MVVACGGLAGFRWRVGGGLLSSRVIVPVEGEVSGGSGRGRGGVPSKSVNTIALVAGAIMGSCSGSVVVMVVVGVGGSCFGGGGSNDIEEERKMRGEPRRERCERFMYSSAGSRLQGIPGDHV